MYYFSSARRQMPWKFIILFVPSIAHKRGPLRLQLSKPAVYFGRLPLSYAFFLLCTVSFPCQMPKVLNLQFEKLNNFSYLLGSYVVINFDKTRIERTAFNKNKIKCIILKTHNKMSVKICQKSLANPLLKWIILHRKFSCLSLKVWKGTGRKKSTLFYFYILEINFLRCTKRFLNFKVT